MEVRNGKWQIPIYNITANGEAHFTGEWIEEADDRLSELDNYRLEFDQPYDT